MAGPSLQRAEIVDNSNLVEEAALVRLQHSPYRALRKLHCRFDQGTLTLQGTVPSYHYKQLAQTIVSDLAGVEQIVNAVHVEA